MAVNWNDYELVLEEESSKECEVTGREMGGTNRYVYPVSELIDSDMSLRWKREDGREGSYGGYQSYTFYFLRVDGDAVYLYTDKHYRVDITLHPDGEEWSSGWYDFGTWSYCVRLSLRKKQH